MKALKTLVNLEIHSFVTLDSRLLVDDTEFPDFYSENIPLLVVVQ